MADVINSFLMSLRQAEVKIAENRQPVQYGPSAAGGCSAGSFGNSMGMYASAFFNPYAGSPGGSYGGSGTTGYMSSNPNYPTNAGYGGNNQYPGYAGKDGGSLYGAGNAYNTGSGYGGGSGSGYSGGSGPGYSGGSGYGRGAYPHPYGQ